ncbi:MAG: nucleotidyl transferase AbiEii/AbiGii toxin family protein [Bacteroidota bacterium]
MAKANEELQSLEIFEIEVLEIFNSNRVLDQILFGGGTMLRLCHNLNRYSTDLDFWLKSKTDPEKYFENFYNVLSAKYKIIDSQNKRFTIIFQIKSTFVNRSLKIEIRKSQENFEWERKIAFSKFTTKQVLVNGLTLEQMMKNKISAFLSRKIIRDCFDIDFLLRRGIHLPTDIEILNQMSDLINEFSEKDFKVTLGSLLDPDEREFYSKIKFTFLQQEITALLNKLSN